MILLHNQHDEFSRHFLETHTGRFSQVIEYPDCVDKYPNVSRFPAVVLTVPEHKRDNSLWYFIKSKVPDYRKRTIPLKDFRKKVKGARACVDGSKRFDETTTLLPKYRNENLILSVVDLSNDVAQGLSPAVAQDILWAALQCTVDTAECTNDLLEETKLFPIDGKPITEEIVPESFVIIFPGDFPAIEKKQKEIKEMISLIGG